MVATSVPEKPVAIPHVDEVIAQLLSTFEARDLLTLRLQLLHQLDVGPGKVKMKAQDSDQFPAAFSISSICDRSDPAVFRTHV